MLGALRAARLQRSTCSRLLFNASLRRRSPHLPQIAWALPWVISPLRRQRDPGFRSPCGCDWRLGFKPANAQVSGEISWAGTLVPSAPILSEALPMAQIDGAGAPSYLWKRSSAVVEGQVAPARPHGRGVPSGDNDSYRNVGVR